MIYGALANSVYRIEEMVFADGRVIRGDWLEHFTLNVLGDEQANTLDGSSDDNAFFGYGGDDVINTGLGNNYVDGGDGNDTIKV
ncbi:hypothetical protein CWC23_18165, partial [Pseudoalteromonas ruthenica]